MTILPLIGSQLVSTNVTDNTEVFNNTIKQNYPYASRVSYNGNIYENYGDKITVQTYSEATQYAENDVVYKDGYVQKYTKVIGDEVPKQPEDYTINDTSLDRSDWENRYVKIGEVWSGYPDTNYESLVNIQGNDYVKHSIYKTGIPEHFSHKCAILLDYIPENAVATALTDPQTISVVSLGRRTKWHDPNNVLLKDSVFSKAYFCDNCSTRTNRLVASNYDFSDVPLTAVIRGIEVQITRKCDSGYYAQDYVLGLYQNGTILKSNNFANIGENWSPTVETKIYGGQTDLLGWDDITVSDLQNASFGVGVEVLDKNSDHIAYIDSIQVKIYYTSEGSATNTITIDNPTVISEITPNTIESISDTVSSGDYYNYVNGFNTIIVGTDGVYARTNITASLEYEISESLVWIIVENPADIGFELVEAINQLKPFDSKNYTTAIANDNMTYVIKFLKKCDSVVLGHLKGDTITVRFYDNLGNVQCEILDQVIDGSIDDRNEHEHDYTTEIFYNIINDVRTTLDENGHIEVIISGDNIELGTLSPTLSINGGDTDLIIEPSLIDYSPSETKTGGVVDYVPGIAVLSQNFTFYEKITNYDKSLRRMIALKKQIVAIDASDTLNQEADQEIGLFQTAKIIGRIDKINALTVEKFNDLDKYFKVSMTIVEVS